MIVELAAGSSAATCCTLAVALYFASRRVPEDVQALRDAALAQVMLGSGMLLRIWHPTVEYGPLLVICMTLYAGHAAWLSMSVRGLLGLWIPRGAFVTSVAPIFLLSAVGLIWPSLAYIGMGLGCIGYGLLYFPFGFFRGRSNIRTWLDPVRIIGVVAFIAMLVLCAWGVAFLLAPQKLHGPGIDPVIASTILGGALLNMIAACGYLLAVMTRLLVRVESHAGVDPLTGALNRRGLDRHLGRRGTRGRTGMGLIAIDLDHFKQINDLHGHAAGDAVLKECAARLQAALRDRDALTRMGGEEFLILAPGLDASALTSVAERIRLSISEQPFQLPDGPCVTVTVSLGLAMSRPGASLESDIARADRALYCAKQEGRNRHALAPLHAAA